MQVHISLMYPEYKSTKTKPKFWPFQCPMSPTVNGISNNLMANFNCTMTYMFFFLKDNYIGQENLRVTKIAKKNVQLEKHLGRLAHQPVAHFHQCCDFHLML